MDILSLMKEYQNAVAAASSDLAALSNKVAEYFFMEREVLFPDLREAISSVVPATDQAESRQRCMLKVLSSKGASLQIDEFMKEFKEYCCYIQDRIMLPLRTKISTQEREDMGELACELIVERRAELAQCLESKLAPVDGLTAG